MSDDIIAAVQNGSQVYFRSKNAMVKAVVGELISFSGTSAVVRTSKGSDECMVYEIDGRNVRPTKSVRIPR